MNGFLQGSIAKLRNPLFLLAVVLVVGTVVYIPGLTGDFVFDDAGNLLINDHLRIEHLDFSSLRAAAFSGDAGPLRRPISMLSFALNYYFTGFNPFYFKLVNLGIHLLNGVSLYLFISLLLRALPKAIDDAAASARHRFLAVSVTAAWLLHPLALTSVLYVVQRMNSLSVLFRGAEQASHIQVSPGAPEFEPDLAPAAPARLPAESWDIRKTFSRIREFADF